MIGHRTHEQLATSVDAMAVILYCFRGQRIKCYCAIELKTVTVSNLAQKAEGVAGRLGKVIVCRFNIAGTRNLFFLAIPEVAY